MGVNKTIIEFEKQDIVKCDDRGRATLGSEFAGDEVMVWIARAPDMGAPEELHYMEGKDREAFKMIAKWAEREDIDWYDIDIMSGEVEDKYGDKHQSPYYVATDTGKIMDDALDNVEASQE